MDKKKRSRWIFAAALLGYALVALVAIAIGISWLWSAMEDYERSQPHVALNGYMNQLTAEYVADKSDDLIASIDHSIQSEADCREALINALSGKFTAAKQVDKSDENHYVYTLRCGPKIIGTMEMESTDQGGKSVWQVTKDSFDLSYLLGKMASVTVPESFSVSVYGQTLGKEYITKDDVPFPLLAGMHQIHSEYAMPSLVTYTAGPFLGDVAFTVADGDGNPVAMDDKTDFDAYLPVPDSKKAADLEKITNTFMLKFIEFTNNKDDEPQRNYNNLTPYMVAGSDLQVRMKGAINDIKWSVDRYGTLDDVDIHKMVVLGDNRYLCDITYVSTYRTAVGREEISNSVQLVFKETGGSLKAEAMLNK